MIEDRKRAFLRRLWEIQAEEGLSYAAMAREIGITTPPLWRAHNDPDREFGLEFALKACDRWPELRSLLFSESPIGTKKSPNGKGEERPA